MEVKACSQKEKRIFSDRHSKAKPFKKVVGDGSQSQTHTSALYLDVEKVEDIHQKEFQCLLSPKLTF